MGAAENELDLVGRNTASLEQCCYRKAVILDTVFDKLDRSFKVV